jgi:hypothetical protein
VQQAKKASGQKVSVAKMIALAAIIMIVVGSVGYFAFTQGQKSTLEQKAKEEAILNKGIETGYNQVVAYLFSRMKACEATPITVSNETLTLISLECLQQRK